MITRCKKYIVEYKKQTGGKKAINADDILWDHETFPPSELIPILQSCIELNKAYQSQYDITRERLLNMPKGK